MSDWGDCWSAGLDHIGFGKSPGKPALVTHYDDLLDDTILFATHLCAHYTEALAARKTRLQEALVRFMCTCNVLCHWCD
jgi:hypothetical protein